jgi:FHS family L-fucose permease-like MFS transporter
LVERSEEAGLIKIRKEFATPKTDSIQRFERFFKTKSALYVNAFENAPSQGVRRVVLAFIVPTGSTGSNPASSLNNEDIHAKLIPVGRMLPFLVVTVLFFLWAIPNNLNDILIRQFMKSFNINRSSAAAIQIWFYLGYFTLAIPAAQLMKRFGYKMGIVTGLILLGAGCWMFYPAAQAGLYTFFLVAQFVIASGLSFLETGSNSFIAQLGPSGSSERRLNLSQAFNPLGSICAGLIGTIFIFSGVKLTDAQVAAQQAAGTYQAYLHAETLRVVTPYMVLGSIAFFWALLVLLTKFPVLGGEEASPTNEVASTESASLLQPHFVFAVIAQFLYVGAQVGTWSYFIPYVESSTGIGDKAAGYMLTGTLAAFAVGRFTSAWLMRHFHAQSMLVVYSVINVILGLVAVVHPSWLGTMCLLTTSLFMSIMFPTIFALGLKGMGAKTKIAGSLLVMAILGGAALTKIMGILADKSSLQTAYLVPVVCFAGVALYGWLVPEHKPSESAG